MFRLYFRAFWGPEPEGGYDVDRPTRAGWAMAVPVGVLAVGATFIGGCSRCPAAGTWWTTGSRRRCRRPPTSSRPRDRARWSWASSASALAPVAIALAWWVFVADPGRRAPPARAPAAHPRAAAGPVPVRRGLRGGGGPARARPRATS